MDTRIIKMKEDVGMSKPKKHANKVGRLTQFGDSVTPAHAMWWVAETFLLL